LVLEAQYVQLKADFINKMYIGSKEANESRYWIRLLNDCDYITEVMFQSILSDAEELIKMLTSTINTTKERTT